MEWFASCLPLLRLHFRVETRHVHAERHLAKAGVARRNGEGYPHPWRGSRRRNGKGGAQRRSAQAQRGRLGKPLAPRGGRSPGAYLALPLQNRPETWFTAKLDGDGSSALDNARRCCMPWKGSRILEQRLQFLSSYQKEEMSVADLCREYGISRPTGYRWINRYEEIGPEGLVDRSRRLLRRVAFSRVP